MVTKKKKSPFMIQDYPELVKYFAAKNPVQLFLFVIPLLTLMLSVIIKSQLSFTQTAILVLFGAFYWTFLEYAIHRFAYHSNYPFKWMKYFLGSFHMYHHAQMDDRRVLNAGFLMVSTVTPVVLVPFYVLTNDLALVAAMGLGTASAHYAYEWVHFMLHYKEYDNGYLAYIQKYHFHHHDNAPMKNFGNTSHFWDVVFGTYDPAYKNYRMSKETASTLITEKKKVSVHA
ncbi:MAG: sterol desaturase family protein [Bacteriovoracaceae bacterium]